jgi:CHRD domain
MHMITIRSSVFSLMFAALLAVGSAAFAETISFKANLKRTSIVPPPDSKGIGTLSAQYDTATKILSWAVYYAGLVGNATAANFQASATVNEDVGVAIPVYGNLTSPIEGSATLNDIQAAKLMSEDWYFTIYTLDQKIGEIRGQIRKDRQ